MVPLRNIVTPLCRGGTITTMDHVLKIGAKGRTVLPASLRMTLKVREGDTLIARVENGIVSLETQESIKGRLRALAAAAKTDGHVVDRLLADRRADAELEQSRRPGHRTGS